MFVSLKKKFFVKILEKSTKVVTKTPTINLTKLIFRVNKLYIKIKFIKKLIKKR